jgi:hypothetical protein
MSNVFERLKKYFAETPQEEIEQSWESTKKDDEVGPTIEEYMSHAELWFNLNNAEKKKLKGSANYNFDNPKYSSGYFFIY